MFGSFAGVLFDGIAYGSLLFVISIGLSVTMGLMNFVNLAHGAFAMVGGYACVMLMTRAGVPFLVTLPAAFAIAAFVGIVLERTLYQRLYRATHLDQVMFSIGLVFMSIAAATYLFGPSQQPVRLPDFLRGQVEVAGIGLGVYRLFLIAVVAAVTIALHLLMTKSRFGSQIRASVDNAVASAGLGINVNRVFGVTFALGSGLAGLGGGLGIDVLGLDPTFPLKYMVYFLLVVAIGGAGTIKGSLVAAMILGISDVAGKYYVPQVGSFIIYFLMVVLMIAFPAGLFGRSAGAGSHQAASGDAHGGAALASSVPQLPNDRWRPAEIVFWVAVVAAFFVFPQNRVLGSQILITALFALSLDLILGYAGIVSLGHAAFFGLGSYVAGLLGVYGWGEPLSGLVIAGLAAAVLGFATSFLVVRGADLARLMVTLGIGLMLFEAANQLPSITGGADGLSGVTVSKIFGVWGFDLTGSTAYVYSAAVLFVLFAMARRIVASPFGLSLRGIRENVRRMPVIGVPVQTRLIAVYTISAAIAGVAGGLLAQTTQFVGLDVFGFPRSADLMIMLVLGGAGRLYGGPIGAAVFMIAHHWLSDLNPIYWQFWLGLLLVVVVLFGRGGLLGAVDTLRARFIPRPESPSGVGNATR